MLTLFSAVFTAGRFIVGIILRHYAAKITIFISCVTAITGCVMLSTTSSELMTMVGIILCGLGLAAGFPVVLGMVGDRYSSFSGTAFGIVLTIALIGNMFINYITGILSEVNGLEAFTWMLIISGVLTLVFISFSMAIFRDR